MEPARVLPQGGTLGCCAKAADASSSVHAAKEVFNIGTSESTFESAFAQAEIVARTKVMKTTCPRMASEAYHQQVHFVDSPVTGC
jgi:hypothetical protein